MNTYKVVIPEQTIKINATSKKEAREKLFKGNRFSFEISKEYRGIPRAGRPSIYYIERFFDSVNPLHWAYKCFFKRENNYIFTDGNRAYSTTDEYLNDNYTDVTDAEPNKAAILEDALAPDANAAKVVVNLDYLKRICTNMTDQEIIPYNIKIGDVIHSVNIEYLLDALMFAGTNEVEISERKLGKFRITGPSGRAAVLMPLNYTAEELAGMKVDLDTDDLEIISLEKIEVVEAHNNEHYLDGSIDMFVLESIKEYFKVLGITEGKVGDLTNPEKIQSVMNVLCDSDDFWIPKSDCQKGITYGINKIMERYQVDSKS